jgi:hypothetical protein
MRQSPERTLSMPESAKASSEDWRLGLTLAERLAAVSENARPKPRVSRRRRTHWREERRADIGRARNLAALVAVEPARWPEWPRSTPGVFFTREKVGVPRV